ncbi:MAG: hypothetical protein HYS27_09475 [Deltaproteobacteria bacterium]|nr:hypothetical protein [Deltaproteobacteria bacterium]
MNGSADADFNADARQLRGTCLPRSPFVEVECFGGDLVAVCEGGACAMAQRPRPPTFSWSSPIAADVIPTNTVVTGTVVDGTDPAERLRALVVTDGAAPRELERTRAHCAVIGGCEDVFALGPLPPLAQVTLRFEAATPGESVSWRTGATADTTAPIIGALTVNSVDVFRNQTKRMFKQIELGFVVPEDDTGIGNYGVTRAVDGEEAMLMERIAAFDIGPRTVDIIDERSGFREACYAFVAWDWAGNTSESEPVCVDVTISDGERSSIPSCSAAGGAEAALAVLLGLCRTRRRPWRAACSRSENAPAGW